MQVLQRLPFLKSSRCKHFNANYQNYIVNHPSFKNIKGKVSLCAYSKRGGKKIQW